MPWINVWWQQVSGTATQGLQITIVGMSLVFLTLGLIIMVLAVLTRLPRLRTKREEQEQDTGLERPPPPSERAVARATTLSLVATDAELAQVAAIAVALVRSQRSSGRRSRVQTPASKWKQYGRAHQLGL